MKEKTKKLAFKRVWLKPRNACFHSDPYHFNKIQCYPSFPKFVKNIYQEKSAYCRRISWQNIYTHQGAKPRKDIHTSFLSYIFSLFLVLELFYKGEGLTGVEYC